MNVQLSQEVLKEAKYRTVLFFHTQTGDSLSTKCPQQYIKMYRSVYR